MNERPKTRYIPETEMVDSDLLEVLLEPIVATVEYVQL
jgi:hypothetical protein